MVCEEKSFSTSLKVFRSFMCNTSDLTRRIIEIDHYTSVQ